MIKIFCANIDSFSEKDYLLMFNMVDLERNRKALKYLQKEDYKRCILGGMLLLFSIYHVKKKIIIPEILMSEDSNTTFSVKSDEQKSYTDLLNTISKKIEQRSPIDVDYITNLSKNIYFWKNIHYLLVLIPVHLRFANCIMHRDRLAALVGLHQWQQL